MPDFWEQLYGLNIFENDAEGDGDDDGVINSAEFEAGSSPISADTDGDGLSDGEEISTHGTDPTKEDSDEDGFSDGEEIAQGFDPLDGERYPQWNWGDKNYSSPVRWVDAGGEKLSNAYSSLGHVISDYWASSNQYVNFSGGYAVSLTLPLFQVRMWMRMECPMHGREFINLM